MRLTRKAFRAWLAGYRPGEAVGIPSSESACPLACFLSDNARDEYAYVHPNRRDAGYIDWGDRTTRLPRWANDFGLAVDDQGGSIISAEAAIFLLDRGTRVARRDLKRIARAYTREGE